MHDQTRKSYYLHNANGGSTVIGEVLNGDDDICGVEEGLCVSRHEHEEAHEGDMRLFNDSGNG